MKMPSSRASARIRHAFFNCLNNACLAILFSGVFAPTTWAQQSAAKEAGLRQIRSYIAAGWDTLTRSLTECKVIVDPKLAASSVLYLPADFDPPSHVHDI